MPSEPKDTLPKITEKDLLDPIGDTYGVDATPAEKPEPKTFLGIPIQDRDSYVSPKKKTLKGAGIKEKMDEGVYMNPKQAFKRIMDEVKQYGKDFDTGKDVTVNNYLTGLEALARSGIGFKDLTLGVNDMNAEETLEFILKEKEKIKVEGPTATAKFLNEGGKGFNWSKLDNAAIEQGVNIFASIAAAAGVTAATGNPALGLAGPFRYRS